MIHLSNYDALKNYKDAHISRSSNSNIDKPSYPKRLRLAMPKFVDQLEQKTLALINKYPWINSISTTVSIEGSRIRYTDRKQNTITFESLELGRYHVANQMWYWSWIDEQNQFVNGAKSLKLREWAANKGYEFMTKASWQANYRDTIETAALSVALKSGMGIEINERDGFKYYYILLELV